MAGRRRWSLVVVVVVAVVAGWLLWPDDDAPAGQRAGQHAGAGGRPGARAAQPTDRGLPAWLGQRGVAGRRIAGIVLHDGAPLAGATVRLASPWTRAGAMPAPLVETDASGRFDFGVQPATKYRVIAEKPKHTAAAEAIDLRDPRVAPEDLHLVLHDCDASLHGTIHDAADGVIAGARVAPFDDAAGSEADAEGRYEVCVPVGAAMIEVSADGYARHGEWVEASGPTRRDFVLVPEAIVMGRVVRARDQSPVVGAVVELRRSDTQIGGYTTSSGTTDATGTFQIDAVFPGSHVLSATADGLATAHRIDVIAFAGPPQDPITIALDDAFTVTGKVVERGSGGGVGGREVYLLRRSAEPLLSSGTRAMTQADGTFSIENVPPAEYSVRVGYVTPRPEPPAVTVAGHVTGLVLEVERGGSISGRITHRGKPVEGASVSARTTQSTRSARSDHEGRFTLRELGAADYSMYAQSNRVGAFTRGSSITIADGEHRRGVELELDLSASISGVVIDQHDRPVAGAVLRFSLLGGRDFGQATTADDGTFTATALSGGGDYVYEVRPHEHAASAFPPTDRKRFPPIVVRDGTTRVTGVRIRVRREQLAIGGRVVDARGAPIDGALVHLVPQQHRQVATTDGTGAFRIAELAPGAYTLRATARAGEVSVPDVAAGRADVVVAVPDPGGIAGTLEGFAEPPRVTIIGGAERRYPVTVNGTVFRASNLPGGVYRITALAQSGAAFVEAKVAPGAVTEVTLHDRGLGSIAGTVVDGTTKQPKVGVRCLSVHTEIDFDVVRPRPVETDGTGTFRLDRVFAGPQEVYCSDGTGPVRVTVLASETVRVELVARPPAPAPARPKPADSGLVLEDQLDEVRARAVVPGSPAARAGFHVGDIITRIGDETVTGSYDAYDTIRSAAIGTQLKVTIERDDAQRVLVLPIEAVSDP